MPKLFHDRHFPVRPNLDQLRNQAKDLLRAIRRDDSDAIEELRKHRRELDPAAAKLADAQFALARSYGLASWPRLVTACRMTDAIWRGDVEAVRELIVKDPKLLHEVCARIGGQQLGTSDVVCGERGTERDHRNAGRDGRDRRTTCLRPRLSAGENRDCKTPSCDGSAPAARMCHGTVRDAESGRAGIFVRAGRRTCR